MWPYFLIIGFVGAGHLLPYPQEAVFATVGHLAARYGLDLPLTIVLAVAAALAGDLALYTLARGGSRLLTHLATHISTEAMNRLKARLGRRAFLTVFFLRLFPVTRTLVVVAGGLVGVPWRTFAIADLLGIGVLAPIFVILGYRSYATVISYLHAFGPTATYLSVAGLLAVGYALYLLNEQRHHRAAASAAAKK